jgi:group I intron endonuclease
MVIYSIYKATNKINNKSYIGFDSNWPMRKYKHKERSEKSNQALYCAIRKYGWNSFEWEIIYQSLDGKHCLKYMEPFFILEYQTYTQGYNMTIGGDGSVGYKHSKESKELMRILRMGKSFNHKPETKIKIGNKLRGRKYTTEQLKNYGKNYIITTPDGLRIAIKNLNKFCRENNLDCGHMVRVAKGVRKKHKKYKCEYV